MARHARSGKRARSKAALAVFIARSLQFQVLSLPYFGVPYAGLFA
jgi:hypothetical protein